MCGFVGTTRLDLGLEAAIASIGHRGPDDTQVDAGSGCSLAFARLAIIDLTDAARQPMTSADGQVRLVFNGEVYGYQDLRSELAERGHVFRSGSDTEVVLEAYLEWGEDCVRHLEGMFAFAIHDQRDAKVRLFRDRPGIKPLYYAAEGGELHFASELKALVALIGEERLSVDHTALFDYLTYLYIPSPKTLYREVRKLPPAHVLVYDLDEKRVSSLRRYWTLAPDPAPRPRDVRDAGEEIRSLVRASVTKQLVADVPVGVMLSGGLDSSTVVAEAASVTSNLRTFTIDFDVASHSEAAQARVVSERFGTRHRTQLVSAADSAAHVQRMKEWYDEPFADTSAIPTYLVSKLARENVKVALAGDGGDEVFGGYWWYQRFERRRRLFGRRTGRLAALASRAKARSERGTLWYRLLHQAEMAVSPELACYALLMGAMSEAQLVPYAKAWGIPRDYDRFWHFRRYYRSDLPVKTRLQFLDFHTYLPGDILTKVDRASMAVSLEVRVPLLDTALVECLFSLPESFRYHAGRLKGGLKAAYADVLPQRILQGPKRGFSLPTTHLNQVGTFKQETVLEQAFGIRLPGRVTS